MQVPLDKDGNYTIVYGRKEDRPNNATLENGTAWIGWSPPRRGDRRPEEQRRFRDADAADHGAGHKASLEVRV
jgi:hypothetical protein